MKGAISSFIISILTLTLFFSCENSYAPDWYGISSNEVPAQVGNALKSMYPYAESIEWEYRDGYYTAIFRSDGFMTEAWYTHEAHWLLSVTDISYTALPQLVLTYIESHGYTPKQLEKCNKISRPHFVETYQIRYATKEFLCTEAGYSIKEAETLPPPYPIDIPISVWEGIQTQYPNSMIIEAVANKDSWYVKVRTSDNNIAEMTLDIYGNSLDQDLQE